MIEQRLVAGIAIALAPLWAAVLAHAQDYPTKPVRLVTAEIGGGHDQTARLLAQGLSADLGQQFVVDNRSGAVIAGEYVSKAPADGYTLLIYGGSLWFASYMRSSVPYDVQRDFAPIGLQVNAPILLVVHPTLPVKNTKELIALAKSKPGQLDYATGQTGATTHLASELFKIMANVDMLRIPYRGNGPAMNALIGGQVQVMFPTAGSVAGQMKAGRVRALAITSAKPSVLFPDLPTVASAGLNGFSADSIIGAFAPAKTPAALVSRLSREFAVAVNKPEIKQRFNATGVETIGSTPQEFASAIQSEMTRFGKLIKDLGIKED
jgi:tripartite-type tricarboxylate transporter receptor subunit TctC